MAVKAVHVVLVLAWGVRIFLHTLLPASAKEYLGSRIESMSPITSFARIVEGEHLLNRLKTDPYVTNFFKLNPISASIIFPFIHSKDVYYYILTACDLLTGGLLMLSTGAASLTAGVAFLFNPFTIMSELALSSESLDMLVVAVFLFLVSRENVKISITTLLIAFMALNKPILPFVLVFPLTLRLKTSLSAATMLVAAWTGILHAVCYGITGGSWSYLESSFRLDLEPTMGFMWNLLTMSFAETTTFFKIVVFGHLFLVSVPIYWRFGKNSSPEQISRYLQLMVASFLLFQPYPTAINYALMNAILMACDDKFHDKISKLMSTGIFVGQAFTAAAAPLWLERNTGNPNFLFYLDVVSTFIGILAIGQSLRATRLAGYTMNPKKLHKE